jgi:hypothetical protein
MAARENYMEILASEPPSLQGGGAMEVLPLDSRHAWIRLKLGTEHTDLMMAAFLSVPYPSGLRRLLAREPDLQAVVVDRIPPGLAETAAAEGISIIDRNGYGRVVRSGFVYVAPAPPRPSTLSGGSSRSPFAPKASRVVRLLLVAPRRRWRLTAIADEVGVDPGNTHRILASLLETGMVERDEDEYVVTDPGSLLEAWAEFNRWPRERIRLPVSGRLESTIRDLVEVLGDEVAISGEFAAERWAPSLPAQSALLHCFGRSAWERLGQDAASSSFSPPGHLPSGQLLVTLADAGMGQFGDVVDGFPLAHPVQVFIDLYRARDRGREAAEHLRHELLRY